MRLARALPAAKIPASSCHLNLLPAPKPPATPLLPCLSSILFILFILSKLHFIREILISAAKFSRNGVMLTECSARRDGWMEPCGGADSVGGTPTGATGKSEQQQAGPLSGLVAIR